MTAKIICFWTNNINCVVKMLFPHGSDCITFYLTFKLLIKRWEVTCTHNIHWSFMQGPCTLKCPCEKKQGPKTLPDFISRSAEHILWDGDIYMALYTTASCWRPKALAKSAQRPMNVEARQAGEQGGDGYCSAVLQKYTRVYVQWIVSHGLMWQFCGATCIMWKIWIMHW